MSSPFLQVGLRDLDGQVDSAGPLGEGRLEEVGPVGGEDERDVAVAGQAVHRLQDAEQQRLRAVVHAAVHGDEVDVLEDDDRGLQRPGQLGRLADEL
jgi:hypothetical protein